MFNKPLKKYGSFGIIQIVFFALFTALYLITLIWGGVVSFMHYTNPPEHQLPSSVGYDFTVMVRSILYGFLCIIIGFITRITTKKPYSEQATRRRKIGFWMIIQGFLFAFAAILYLSLS